MRHSIQPSRACVTKSTLGAGRSTLLAAAAVLAAATQNHAQTFVDVTASAGISYTQSSTPLFEPENLTGGAAVADVDGDGWVDLFVTRIDAPDILYRNKGDGTFEDISTAAGFTATLSTNGPAFADIDNDGDQDLYVTATNESRFYLYLNDGSGNFSEQAVARNAHVPVTGPAVGQSIGFGDYDRDGYLDAATGSWGTPYATSASRLLHNDGAANPGHFQDVTIGSGVDQFRHHTNSYRFSPRFADMDNDGLQDLVIAADSTTSQLFWNNGDGTFTDGTIAASVGTDNSGMGSAVADIDADGDLDWFVTAIHSNPHLFPDTGNRLFVNNGDRTFVDQTDAAGVRNAHWGWATTFLDYDNDGDLDLMATNGWNPGNITDPTKLWRNDNGVFTDVSVAEGVTDTLMGKGLLSFDYDNDGDLDVFITNNQAQPILYENTSINDGGDNGNHWLIVETEGTDSNRDGIGATIRIDPDSSIAGDEQYRFIDGGSNYLSHNQMFAHFGLGTQATLDKVTITWPSGIVQQFFNIAANTTLSITESQLPGDLDGDGFVGINDLNLVLANWNQNVLSGLRLKGDTTSDGFVGIDDLNLILGNWNQGSPPNQQLSIPEPATLPLMAIAFSLLPRRNTTTRDANPHT